MGSKRVSRVFMVFISCGVLSGAAMAQPDDGEVEEIEKIVKKQKVSSQSSGQLSSYQPQQIISSSLRNDPQWSFLWNPPRAQHGLPGKQGRPLFFPMTPCNGDQHTQQTHEVLIPQPLWNGQLQRPPRNEEQQIQQVLGPQLWWGEELQGLWQWSLQQSRQVDVLSSPLNEQQVHRLPETPVIIIKPKPLSGGHKQEIFKKPLPKKKFLPTQGGAFKRSKDLP